MIDFTTPPINELVLDVQFKIPSGLQSIDLYGIRKLFIEEYPKYKEMSPLAEELEKYDAAQIFSFGIGETPPSLRRQWYINQQEDKLFQIQDNRFIHNWRKLDPSNTSSESYPQFDSVFLEFKKYFLKFSQFLKDKTNEAPKMLQWEITKFNFIPLVKDNWIDDFNKIFTFCSDQGYGKNTSTENITYKKKTLITSDNSKPIGRMYTFLDIVDYEKDKKAAIYRLTVKGHAEKFDIDHCFNKIKEYNKYINNTFLISTNEHIRKERWGQK